MVKIRSLGIAALLGFAFAGALCAQISPGTAPNGTVGIAYSVQLTETEVVGVAAPVTWSVAQGALPPGLTLDSTTTSTTTFITGTPTAAGTYQFEIEATYPEDPPDTQSYTIVVAAACVPVIVPASPFPSGDVGLTYTRINLTVTGCGGAQYTYAVQQSSFAPSTFPPGLNLSTNGTLSGTPTTKGTYSFIITITDQNNVSTDFSYTLTVAPLPTITTASPLPNGPVGVPYSQQIAATGGVPPYQFSSNGILPPGLTLNRNGILSGTPTTAGTFSNFNLAVTDSVGGQTVSPFQVSFATAVSQILVSPLSLSFNSTVGGNPPPTQAIALVPATGTTPPVNYSVVIDNGQNNTAAPSWVTVTPTSGAVPAGLVVSVDQASMTAGTYPARIQVKDGNGFATDVAVTLTVVSAPQQLTVAPAILNFAARSATPGNLTEELVVSNTGLSSLGFSTSVVNNSSWISSVTAASNTTARNAPVFVQVQVNTSGLPVGAYHDAILVSSTAGNIQVPVSLFVAASGPILAVNTTGVLFQAIQGGGSTATRIVKILNLGDPSSTVNWSASLFSGSNWLSLVSSNGTATGTAPGSLTLALAPNDRSLTPGPYYAIIKITDSNSLNSPQYVTAVLNLEPNTAAPGPDLAPVGLFFTTPVGGSAPTAQQVQINTSSSTPVTFNASASTFLTGTWLSVTPATGSASGQASGSVAVSVNPTGLTAGIYSGDINVSIGSLLQSVNVTFVVQNNGTSSASSRPGPEAAGCTASKLAITETGLANNFAVPAGWPATLIVQLNNDCAASVTNGNVVASFSNGDAPLNLVGDTLGNYSTTWQPGDINSNMVVTLNATAGTLQPAIAKLYGGIAPNQTPPPTVSPNGTVNNLNPVGGAPLSPGTIAQVYGTGLASSSNSTGPAPLPMTFDNTFALVGSTQAPLYFLSSGQINIQVPNEAPATQQVPIVLSVNNALTLPVMLSIVPATPGVLSSDDGPTPPDVQNGAHIIAQHSADFSLVSSANPAKAGEYLVMYLVGMGPTNPSVPSGAATPNSPLSPVVNQPTVTVASQPATVAFAGLTPAFVGLYQINFQVPTGASSGELEVDVTQNGVAANQTLLPVSN
ncbi:MAG TPA: putative Ig domain-containing protein [Bryobacteraceae bacterium]|nr:putative Ig domain-containing protein [Bryobacteraceae bacterium]